MVITCPSCAARYRLNPDKVQGRGAKITCPKCSHVFVVFTDQDAAAAAPGPPKAPSVRSTPRPAAPPTSEEDSRAATQTGAFRAVGIAPEGAPAAPSPGSSNQVRIVAPGPRSTRRLRALSSPSSTVPVAGDGDATPDDPGDITSAKDLDFRAVGIKTWKVKVAIGLIYDFSDIATLKKYLADKKVTPDDLISHNNEDWIRIGDIGDLEEHFIVTWRAAKAAIDSGEAPKPATKKKITTPGAPIPAGTSSDAFRLDGNRGRSTGNYPTPAPPRRREPEPEDAPPRDQKKLLGILAAVLVIGGVAWFYSQPKDVPVAVEPPPQVAVPDIGPTDAELAAIQARIRHELEEERHKINEELTTPGEGSADEDDVAERKLVPVPPSERSTPTVVSPSVTPSIPKYTPPPKPQVAEAAPSPTPAPVATVKEKTGDPARMYLDVGRKKLASGDFGSARQMFEAAIKKNGSCAECYRGLAEAEKELGNADAAAAANKKADALGNTQSLASP